MGKRDSAPLSGTPVTQRIASVANNRLGAVYSALYSFWSARANAIAAAGGIRGDAYSVIIFNNRTEPCFENDLNMDAGGLLNIMLRYNANGATDFNQALQLTETIMERHWNASR
jgi:hypothetical protein